MAIEPALRAATVRLAGGLHLPDDETGDCHKFTVALAELLSRRGVGFKFDTNVQRLLFEGERMTGVITNQGMLDADAYVVALGSEAARACDRSELISRSIQSRDTPSPSTSRKACWRRDPRSWTSIPRS